MDEIVGTQPSTNTSEGGVADDRNTTVTPDGGTDITKTRFYALTDLVTKVLSAIALVALGIAGWWFQKSTDQARRDDQAQKGRAREYLPALRSLNEAELVLDEVTYQLRRYRVGPRASREQDREAYYLGNRVRVAASAIFLPKGDRPRTTRSPISTPKPTWVQLPLRPAMLMLEAWGVSPRDTVPPTNPEPRRGDGRSSLRGKTAAAPPELWNSICLPFLGLTPQASTCLCP